MTKTFELSYIEIKNLHELSLRYPGTKFKLKYTTDGTQGMGYHLFVKAIDFDGNYLGEVNKDFPKQGLDISDDSQF